MHRIADVTTASLPAVFAGCAADPCFGVICPGPTGSTMIGPANLAAFPPGPLATITFDEVSVGTTNPVYPPSLYGFASSAFAPTVTFGGFFEGQSLSNTAQVTGRPTTPLALKSGAQSFTGSVPFADGVVLSGNPDSLGPTAILLSHPVAAIGVSRSREVPCLSAVAAAFQAHTTSQCCNSAESTTSAKVSPMCSLLTPAAGG